MVNQLHVIELLQALRDKGIRCAVSEGKLQTKAPAGALNEQLKQQILFHKEALISTISARKPKAQETRDIDAEFRASIVQQQLWLHQQLSGNQQSYILPLAFSLSGHLQLDALEKALLDVIKRHAPLSSCYEMQADGLLLQPVDRPHITIEQFRSDAEQPAKLAEAITHFAFEPFELSQSLPVRAGYWQLNEQEHILVFAFHHIAVDGWSLGLFLQELLLAYDAYEQNRVPEFETLPLTYADFSDWQHNYIESAEYTQGLQYWLTHLNDAPLNHSLPLDFKRDPQKQAVSAGRITIDLPAQTRARMQAFCRERELTPFMFLHGALALLLSRASQQRDVIIGAPFANRMFEELEPVIGHFVNLLPLRLICDEKQSIDDFFAQVKEINLQAQSHQLVPFENIVDGLNLKRNPHIMPLIQMILAVEHSQLSAVKDVTEYRVQGQPVKFDLAVTAKLAEHKASLLFEYHPGIFSEHRITLLSRQFAALLEGILDTPRSQLENVCLPSNLLEKRTLPEASHRVMGGSAASPLALFHDQVRLGSQKTAICYGKHQVSYAALAQQAQNMAAALIRLGVTKGERLGIILSDPYDAILGFLASGLAGAVYVPLDPVQPLSRLSQFVQTSKLRLIVGQHQALERAFKELDFIAFDVLKQPIEGQPALPLVSESDSAYIMFTSGSTGSPKGVEVSHGAILNLITGDNPVPINQDTVLAQTGSMAFDAATFEIWATLCHGGTLVLFAPQSLDLSAINNAISELGVNTMWMTVGLFSNWSRFLPQQMGTLRHVIFGGDEIATAPVARVMEALPEVTLYNAYGPTENTVFSCMHQLDKSDLTRQKLPMGVPLAGTQAWILDEQQRPVMLGAVGELYVSGANLAKGYFCAPELTHQKFVSAVLDDGSCQRLYRTGDLVRRIEHEQLCFVGRADEQVKIRGYRIEPMEVSHLIQSVSGVKDAITLVQQEGEHKSLVTHLLCAQGTDQSQLLANIKSAVKNHFPSYMQPSAYAIHQQWPLNINGKIDRRALPVIKEQASRQAVHLAETLWQKRLADCWQTLLPELNSSPDVQSNFFELGGNSLLAMRSVAMLQGQWQVNVSLKDFMLNPTIAELAAWLETHQQGSTACLAITHDDALTEYPLCTAQRGLWFLQQWDTQGTNYNIPLAYQIKGDFDPVLAKQVLGCLVDQHVSLRSLVVVKEDGEAVMQIQPKGFAFGWQQDDISDQSEGSQAMFLSQAKVAQVNQGFDLSDALPLRAHVIKQGANLHTLLLTFHHIAVDGWSLEVLAKQFADTYESLASGQQRPLYGGSINFADYCVWERNQFSTASWQKAQAYWREHLKNVEGLHKLPVKQPRKAIADLSVATARFEYAGNNLSSLKAFASERAMSWFSFLHGVFSVALARFSQTEQVITGTPVAMRDDQQRQSLVGMLVNTLVLRVNCQEDLNVSDYFAELAQEHLNALENKDIPFDLVVGLAGCERQSSYPPLVQIVASYEQASESEALTWAGNQVSIEQLALEQGKFELGLHIIDHQERIEFCASYAQCLFEPAMVEQLLRHVGHLLSTFDSQCALAEWGLTRFEDTITPGLDAPQQADLLARIEQHATSYPDALAVSDGKDGLTYSQLCLVVSELAQAIRQLSGNTNRTVAVALNKSPIQTALILAIWAADGTYVPVDERLPRARIQHILDDAQPALIISDADLPDTEVNGDCQTLRLSTLLDMAKGHNTSTASPLTRSDLNKPAYVLYTSGSTGVPKGVMVGYKALSVHGMAAAQTYGIEPEDRVLQFASLNFDASIEQLVVSLVSGASSVLFDVARQDISAEHILSFMCEHQVSCAHFTPTYFSELLNHPQWNARMQHSALGKLIVGGEALLPGLVDQWFASPVSRSCKFINSYGPTETVITATAGVIEKDDNLHVPLGEVIGPRHLAVVNSHQRNVMPYMCGELLVMGVHGVAQGYLNKPDVTSQRFFEAGQGEAHTFGYRTGDMVRLLPDGHVSFIGRNDNQVKVRGYRIELNEIEAHLIQHPDIIAAKPYVTQSEVNDLVCFVETSAETTQDWQQAVSQWLEQRLPGYMVPVAWYSVTHWPKNLNGKLDLAAIPRVEGSSVAQVVAPETQTEKQLARLWQEILQLENQDIGRNSQFFKLGGHSLNAMRLVFLINNRFNLNIGVTDIFRFPTLKGLASHVSQRQQDAKCQGIPTQPNTRTQFPLSPAQFRIWFVENMQSDPYQYNMPFAMKIFGEFEPQSAKLALHTIVQKHEVLRTLYRFDQQQAEVQQHILSDVELPFEYKDLSHLDETEREIQLRQLIQQHAILPFKLETDIPIRAAVVKLCADQWVLVITLHHIACDGWSIGILEEDFIDFYQQHVTQQDIVWQPTSIRYADYALWQSEQILSQHVEDAKQFWAGYLSDAPLLHSLPSAGRSSGQGQSANGNLGFSISKAQAKAIEQYCQQQDITLFMFLQGIFSMAVSQFSHQPDVVIGTPFLNRVHPDVNDLVGCFVNALPIRLVCDNAERVAPFWAQVKAALLAIQEHQGFPFEAIVDLLNPPRDSNTTPVFQLFFSYQNEQSPSGDSAGLLNVEMLDNQYFPVANKYEATLTAEQTDSGLNINLLFDQSRFSSEFAARLLAFYGELVDAVIKHSGQLNIGELVNLVASNGETLAHLPSDVKLAGSCQTVGQLIAHQLNADNQAIAIVDGEKKYSYAEFGHEVSRFCQYLSQQDLNKGDRVAVILPRCSEFLIAAVAIMQRGLVFVPISPDLPVARIEAILDDSQPGLTLAPVTELAFPESAGKVIHWAQMNPQEAVIEAQLPQIEPSDVAYLLYTSGSTGKPKGVEVCHQGVANLVEQVCIQMIPEDCHTWLWLANVGFDISFFEWLGALHCNGQLLITPDHIGADSMLLAEFIPDSVDFIQMTPSRMALLLEIGWQPQPHQTLLLAGEALSSQLQSKLATDCRALWNGYGPTEATIYSMLNHTNIQPQPESRTAIGRGVPNYCHFICDDELNLLPLGAIGELVIGGVGLARGYRNLPEQTASRFIEHRQFGRVYRTGDLVRMAEDGLVHYLGRIDSQVKINGHRVELEEIEQAIKSVSSVDNVVVLATPEHRLVAFLIADKPAPDSTTLRTQLADILPRYMLPNQVITLDTLPLNPNGKADRKALLQLVGEEEAAAGTPVQTERQKVLALLWAEQLSKQTIYLEDDFFVLGGHSVSATRLVNKVNSIFRTSLTLRFFFDNSCVKDIDEALSEVADADVIASTYLEIMAMSAQDVSQSLQQIEQHEESTSL